MRVGVIAFLQESNTFLAGKTTLAHFEQDLLCEGEEVRRRMGPTHHEVGGFFAGLDAAGLDAVPIFAARALPYGVIVADAFDALVNRLLAALDRAGPLDGLLVAPHGATVAENHPDADGYWLTQVRERVGPTLPIISTLDLHANLTPKMVAACDAVFAYRSNPHLDQKQRGLDAAALMGRTFRGEVRPVTTARFPPLAVNIERQLTAESPCRELYAFADTQLTQPGVLANSVVLGFPYADVPEMGATVTVTTDGDRGLADRLAADLAGYWWNRRAEFTAQLISVDDAVRRAAALPGRVCLLDMGDNTGGGSPADGTVLAHALSTHGVGPSFVCLADAEAERLARAAGIGTTLTLTVGGKSDTLHGPPLTAAFTVRSLTAGTFSEPSPRHGGFTTFDQGPTAVVETAAGLTVMLTARRMAPFSLNQLIGNGVDPTRFKVLVAKGVHAPVAAYAPVCDHLIRVDTPGVTSADLGRLSYRHRRRPMFPFELDTVWGAVD